MTGTYVLLISMLLFEVGCIFHVHGQENYLNDDLESEEPLMADEVEMSMDRNGFTTFGFVTGPVEVSKLYSTSDGSVAIRISTDSGKKLNVYCSPTGRSLRVFNGKGVEMR